MSTFWSDRFKGTPPSTPTQKELSEVIARLPYRITSPAAVTHLPFFGKSTEDNHFDALKAAFIPIVGKAINALKEKTSASYAEIRSRIVKLQEEGLVNINLNETLAINGSAVSSSDLRECIFGIAIDILKTETEKMAKNNFEMFAFECRQYIILDLNRQVHDKFISMMLNDESLLMGLNVKTVSSEISTEIYKYINLVVSSYTIFLIKNTIESDEWLRARKTILVPHAQGDDHDRQSDDIDSANFVSADLDALHRDMLSRYNHQNSVGGIVSLLKENHRKIEETIVSKSGNTVEVTQFTDRRLLYTRAPQWDGADELPVPSHYVVWDRGNSSWRYTFYQGSAQAPKINVSGVGCELSGDYEPKGETQSAKTAKHNEVNEFDQDVIAFIDKLVTEESFGDKFMKGCFPEEGEWDNVSTPFHKDPGMGYAYGFPGRRHGGAMYMVFDIEMLVILLFAPVRVADARLSTRIGEIKEKFPIKDSEYIKHLSLEISRSLRCEERDVLSNVKISDNFHYLCDALNVQGSERADISMLCINIKYASRIEAKADIFQQLRRRAHRACAIMLEFLWKATANTSSKKRWIDENDFIASSVIDGRAVYFSNFRPYVDADEPGNGMGLTRTFFLDLGLEAFQRGRLVRRLVDLATYRLACVRDFERIRALGYGLNEIHDDLGQLQRREFFVSRINNEKSVKKKKNGDKGRKDVPDVTDHQHVSNTSSQRLDLHEADSLGADRKIVNTLLEDLEKIQKINIRLSQFNAMITGGITDRRASTSGHMSRIRNRLSDLREQRIHGYARLDEFIERGVARAVNEVARTAQRYETIRERSQSHLVTVTTQIAAVEARMFSNFSTEANSNLRDLKDLFAKADLLIIVGGAYYILSMIYGSDKPGWSIFAAFLLLFILKVFWPYYDDVMTRGIRLIWDTIKFHFHNLINRRPKN